MDQEVTKISKAEVRRTLKSGKTVGPDDIPVKVWKSLVEVAVEF